MLRISLVRAPFAMSAKLAAVADVRRESLPPTIGRTYSTHALRESLRLVGPKHPALYFNGDCIDGRRRLELGAVLRIKVPTIEVRDRIQAARELWHFHPQRAYDLFAPRNATRVQLISLFGCEESELPTPKTAWGRVRRKPRSIAGTPKAVTPVVQLPRELLDQAHAVCRSRGISLSAAIRGLVDYLAAQQDE